MPIRARGTFVVKLKPLKAYASADDPKRARMSIDKVFEGDLEGTSRGEMLTMSTTVKESAVYVAIERVHGTLHGRSGTFALAHTGTMTRGVPHLTIAVVPDSGTGDLAGISGSMSINIAGGDHSYELDYELPPS
ncbi:MAG TPA: DUF3224 domain-containing protein [Gemmatimonadaceae bacterium]|nr:DUF3224 domain-containing protein [Gemmatimonadaceae bacterium]